MTRDILTGGVCLAVSLLLLAATRGLPEASALVPIGPGAYPRVVLAVAALLSLLVLVTAIRERRRAPAEATGPGVQFGTRNHLLVATTFALFALYVWLLPLVGFRLSTALFVLVLQVVLAPPRSLMGWYVALVIAVVVALGAHAIFERGLGVLLPRGTFLKL